MNIGQRILRARIGAQLSASHLASLAGVATSTVTRIEAGRRMPGYDLAVRLLQAAGVGENLQPLSCPSAIATVRSVVDADNTTRPAQADFWLEAWSRIGLIDGTGSPRDVKALAFRAGMSAALYARPGAVDIVRGESTWGDLVACLDSSGRNWASTGDTAANRLTVSADTSWPVFYVDDMAAAGDAIGRRLRVPGEYGKFITLIPFDGFSESGRWRDRDGIWFADPWQVIMDCYGGVQRMPEQADRILELHVIAT